MSTIIEGKAEKSRRNEKLYFFLTDGEVGACAGGEKRVE
jgi:hypothetical protein